MQYGYGRVSRSKQDTALQQDALRRFGVTNITTEKWSSVGERPELQRVLSLLGPGDSLVVWKFDRVGRSLRDLLRILDLVMAAGATFVSLTECIDTRTPVGKLVYSIVGAVAEFEKTLILERTHAGLVSAIRKGSQIGRPKVLSDRQEWRVIEAVLNGESQRAVAARFGVSQDVVKMAYFRVVRPEHPRLRGNGMHVLGPLLRCK